MSNYQESTRKCYTANGRASWNRNFYEIQPPCYWIVWQMISGPVPATLPALRDRQTDSLYLSTMILKAMQLMGSYIKTIPKNEIYTW